MIPKFRAWDKHVKKIRKVTEIHFDDSLIYLKANNGKGYYCSFSDIELMQSTGLKDKNGVEIFEGDVIKCVIHSRKYIGQIEYSETLAAWYITGMSRSDTELWLCNSIEVIKNIYENPELLEGE